jgi:hypothetical protein
LSNYTKSTNFATKDNLTPGDPLKIVRGTEIDTEFNNIATAIATKTDNASAAITGGTINDTTIGATTASTGAFTTLAASGNVTLSGGTANGVAYLNGSKVVTSGSALTFDGTTFQSSVSASGEIFKITGTGSGAYTTSVFQNTNAGGYVQQIFNVGASGASGQAGIQYAPTLFCSFGTLANDATTPITFKLNGSEQMRLTSTGLGIGTSSPISKLHVFKSSDNQLQLQCDNTGTVTIDMGGTTTPAKGGIRFSDNSGSLLFRTNSSTQATLDSSGNLGLGVTPSANDYTGAAQFKWIGHSLTPRSVDDFALTMNAYHNGGGWKYGNTANASAYIQSSAGHAWFTAPSGTAGNAITFTQAMTLDASGNLLIATTSTTGNGAAFQPAGSGGGMMLRIAKASEGTAHQFAVNSSVVGSIYANPSSTSYNTSSDYRLKNTITPMTGALAKVALLKPCTYKWNVDGSDGEGFIAHELAEVVPQCVSGEKDAVDEEGNPQYQGIDTSFLVATLTAAIQELKAEFDAYKASHP